LYNPPSSAPAEDPPYTLHGKRKKIYSALSTKPTLTPFNTNPKNNKTPTRRRSVCFKNKN
jgi:hypothetical protein